MLLFLIPVLLGSEFTQKVDKYITDGKLEQLVYLIDSSDLSLYKEAASYLALNPVEPIERILELGDSEFCQTFFEAAISNEKVDMVDAALLDGKVYFSKLPAELRMEKSQFLKSVLCSYCSEPYVEKPSLSSCRNGHLICTECRNNLPETLCRIGNPTREIVRRQICPICREHELSLVVAPDQQQAYRKALELARKGEDLSEIVRLVLLLNRETLDYTKLFFAVASRTACEDVRPGNFSLQEVTMSNILMKLKRRGANVDAKNSVLLRKALFVSLDHFKARYLVTIGSNFQTAIDRTKKEDRILYLMSFAQQFLSWEERRMLHFEIIQSRVARLPESENKRNILAIFNSINEEEARKAVEKADYEQLELLRELERMADDNLWEDAWLQLTAGPEEVDLNDASRDAGNNPEVAQLAVVPFLPAESDVESDLDDREDQDTYIVQAIDLLTLAYEYLWNQWNQWNQYRW
jgi:hypothetical protein